MEKIYLQLYSLEEAQSHLPSAFEKLAAIGYTGVEFAENYGGLNAKDLKKCLADYGLQGLSAHVSLDRIEARVEFLAEVGIPFAVNPHANMTNREDTLRLAEAMNKAGALCQKHHILYGYHNHMQEFAQDNGEYLMDILIANTDPALCMIQLDVGWAATAGVDPVAYINRHAGRIKLIHAKESGKVMGVQPPMDFSKITFDENGKPIFTEEMIRAFTEMKQTNVPTGQGIIDWAAVKQAADAQGAEAYIVEREWNYQNDIFACVQADYAYLKTI